MKGIGLFVTVNGIESRPVAELRAAKDGVDKRQSTGDTHGAAGKILAAGGSRLHRMGNHHVGTVFHKVIRSRKLVRHNGQAPLRKRGAH